MSDASKSASLKFLLEMCVKVKTNTIVKDYDGNTLTLNNGEKIKCKNVIWAAGVKGNIINGLNEDAIVKQRYKVDRRNKLLDYQNIYAIGDIAYMITPKWPNAHPQLANVAIHQGKNLAKNFNRLINNKTLIDYEYKDLGSMATVGKYKAVIDLPFAKFQGVWAWFIWMFLHLMLILGVRNKLLIFINWAWNFFTKDTSLRLIFRNKS
jgi:NADH dehydrogenase